jgi:hypothetical protein
MTDLRLDDEGRAALRDAATDIVRYFRKNHNHDL